MTYTQTQIEAALKMLGISIKGTREVQITPEGVTHVCVDKETGRIMTVQTPIIWVHE
jgi:hypothetical protein